MENVNMEINGMNILHLICRYSIFSQLIKYVINIIKTKFNIDPNSLNVTDQSNKTPIDYLFERNHPDLIETALTCGLTINNLVKYVNASIQTCIGQSVTNLIDKLDNINEIYNGMSPLFTAIRYKKQEIIDYICSKNVDIEQRINNVNAIHYAIQCGDPNIAIQFIDRCSDLEEEAYDGWKLIHLACYYCPKNVITYLLDRNVLVTTPINKFKGQTSQNLPINLIELNGRMNDTDKDELIEFMIVLMEIQSLT